MKYFRALLLLLAIPIGAVDYKVTIVENPIDQLITHYNVYLSEGDAAFRVVTVIPGNTNSIVVPGITQGRTRWYVTAVSAIAEGPPSNIEQFPKAPPDRPAGPKLDLAKGPNGTVDVTVSITPNKPEDMVTEYLVYMAPANGDFKVVGRFAGNQTRTVIRDIPRARTTWYVGAVSPMGESWPSLTESLPKVQPTATSLVVLPAQ